MSRVSVSASSFCFAAAGDAQNQQEEAWDYESERVSTQCVEQCKSQGLLVLPAVETDTRSVEEVVNECKTLLRPLLEHRER